MPNCVTGTLQVHYVTRSKYTIINVLFCLKMMRAVWSERKAGMEMVMYSTVEGSGEANDAAAPAMRSV